MKMANIDAVFDYNFTYPKTSDGVSIPQSMLLRYIYVYCVTATSCGGD